MSDIEVPNLVVDVNSWTRSACYPRGSFYPLSDGPSYGNHRITRSDFRPARLVGLAVKLPSALALNGRLLCGLREPWNASVTLWEATAPVKLPA